MTSLGKCLVFSIIFAIILGSNSAIFAKQSHKKHRKNRVHHSLHRHTKTPYAIHGEAALTAEINRIVNSGSSKRTLIGVKIKSMQSGSTLYSRNEQHFFVPASTLKILTAEAALLYLGKNYTFPTRILTNASSIQNGTLNGNLYLVHSGDPSLTYENLVDLMADVKSRNIQDINGNVYIDNTAYDQINFGPGWLNKDQRFCYSAPINASIIDHNCLPIKITPASSSGWSANVLTNPRYYYTGIRNSVITKNSGRACYIHLGTESDNIISLNGCMRKGHYSQTAMAVISDIVQYNKSLMQNLCRRFGIRVNGRVDAGSASGNLSTVAIHQSEPLSVLITTMLKKSDNIIAGSLFKKLGEMYTRQPGSWENGSSTVKRILSQQAGVNISGMTVLDGSGLSRYNQVSPAQLMQVLNFAYHDNAISQSFISALPIAGKDGTLKHRMQNIAGRVQAKTGTMSGVVSIAGYTMSKDKEPIAFVIIVNGRNGMGWRYKEIENNIVTALTRYQS